MTVRGDWSKAMAGMYDARGVESEAGGGSAAAEARAQEAMARLDHERQVHLQRMLAGQMNMNRPSEPPPATAIVLRREVVVQRSWWRSLWRWLRS